MSDPQDDLRGTPGQLASAHRLLDHARRFLEQCRADPEHAGSEDPSELVEALRAVSEELEAEARRPKAC